MKIVCVSDLHGNLPDIPSGDLLIVAGDLTARDTEPEYLRFNEWISEQKFDLKIIIGGNHDCLVEKGLNLQNSDSNVVYLQDSGYNFQGLKIWGFPWTYKFKGINPKCTAFTLPLDDFDQMNVKANLIPDDVDILVSHGPPYSIADEIIRGACVGCPILLEHVKHRINPSFHIFGHVHECAQSIVKVPNCETSFINCSVVDERYKFNRKCVVIYTEGNKNDTRCIRSNARTKKKNTADH